MCDKKVDTSFSELIVNYAYVTGVVILRSHGKTTADFEILWLTALTFKLPTLYFVETLLKCFEKSLC